MAAHRSMFFHLPFLDIRLQCCRQRSLRSLSCQYLGRVNRFRTLSSEEISRLFTLREKATTECRSRLSMTFVKSSGLVFSYHLTHPLSGNVGQVAVFVVRFMVSPHDK